LPHSGKRQGPLVVTALSTFAAPMIEPHGNTGDNPTPLSTHRVHRGNGAPPSVPYCRSRSAGVRLSRRAS
jgi:hypothetical protein